MENKQKEIETDCYVPTIITFKKLGYRCTEFKISGESFNCEFRLKNTSIDSIVICILRFCNAYEISRDELLFETSGEIFNAINAKTLSSSKTVWELFKEQNIEIKEAKYEECDN